MILLDANILLRIADSQSATYAQTVAAVFRLRQNNRLVIIPQSLHEFWAVATRNVANNGLGMDSERAMRWMHRFQQMFPMMHERNGELVLQQWLTLVHQFRIGGFQAHDAKYVAAMLIHRIPKLMTYNLKHFQVFPIELIDPKNA